ncbi:MAG: metallophosphoesterase [Actinomycetota bacterium]|nr:metallophosphoesterase [Actinomycetota bacterium]
MSIRTVRSPKLSLFQSLVDDYVLGARPHERTSRRRPTLDHPTVHAAAAVAERLHRGEPVHRLPPPPELASSGAAATAWECTKVAAALFLARLEGRRDEAVRLEDELKYGTCDPGWLDVMAVYEEHYGLPGHHRVPYVTYQAMDDFVLDVLPRDATIALIGDWGTGTEEAVDLLGQVARKRPDVLVHLGDIYYSGTARETHSHFLALCDEVLDRRNRPVPIYTMSGNHDMYSGGRGFYELLPLLNPAPPFDPGYAQRASYFCLRTHDRSWQLLAMDTGLHDHDPFSVASDVTFLEDREARWHLDKIGSFAERGGKTILLSHHQLFSPFEYIGSGTTKPPGKEAYNPKLLDTFAADLAAGRVAAWFWGHEHNLGIYEPYGPLVRGRCIGHSAIPVYESNGPYVVNPRIPDPPALVSGSDGRPVELPLDAHGVYGHGYVILRFDGAARTAEASYYLTSDEERPVYSEVIT